MSFRRKEIRKEEQKRLLKMNRANSFDVLDRRAVVRRMSSWDVVTNAPMVLFIKNELSGLAKVLRMFKDNDIRVLHIESRQSKQQGTDLEIFVDAEGKKGLLKNLMMSMREAHLLSESNISINMTEGSNYATWENKMPDFPRKIADLDNSAKRVLTYGAELDADHPGFTDNEYRQRRKYFADIAYNYKHGHPIQRVQYTEEETKTWGRVFHELSRLYPSYACQEYLRNFNVLRRDCGYREDNIPQLEDVSRFLKERTGFQLRPVAGYLSSRDFLAGLAFRLFHCTQYIRHSSDPLYTPEPDCCHELLGHIPLLADKSFAQFSQEIGLASLGASDDEIHKLATCYFFTVEFGLCMQNGQTRAYGAGLLSSIGELKHALSPNARVLPFHPDVTSKQKCLITTYQDVYFISKSFEEAKQHMREFAATIKRPFEVRYDPYTSSVQVLNSPRDVCNVINSVRDELMVLTHVLTKLQSRFDK
ncbi:tryptophan 5-hydroxylase 1-like [Diadema setosum]|uniref:tryptophan 5-hydroxylase 1-like n=1 Tax=Diadema setosum TaxID=31175 RepID=UPI003B3BBD44